MKKSRAIRWMIAAAISAALLAIVFVPAVRLRPPVHLGATKEEVRASFQAEEQRRLPPYGRTCGAEGASTNEWFLGTEFFLREGHVFAVRRVTLTFSANGVVTHISSSREWRWSL